MRELTPQDFELVELVARGLSRRNRVPWEELQSMGWLGLLRASVHFDPSLGAFEPYATIKIRGEILDRMRAEYGRTKREEGNRRMRMVEAELTPALANLALVKPRDPATLVAMRDMCEHALSFLDARDREVFRMRFWDGASQEDIARAHGVTESRVSQILKKRLITMRTALGHKAPEVIDKRSEIEPLLAM